MRFATLVTPCQYLVEVFFVLISIELCEFLCIILYQDANTNLTSSAPGPQGSQPRLSVVYFSRPANHVILRALVEESRMIAEVVKKTPERSFETGSTSKDWVERRVKYLRANNRKVCLLCGPEISDQCEDFSGP